MLAGVFTVPLEAQQPVASPQAATIASRTAGLDKRDGFVTTYINDRTGALLLEIPRDSMRALFLTTLATGLGSNPIGLDRGSGGDAQVVRFLKAGERVQIVFENVAFRSSGNPDNKRSVDESFPTSTVAALPILAEENGHILFDATELVMRDWNDIGGTLARNNQGQYSVARDRSRINKT